jgi:hypothetical protein
VLNEIASLLRDLRAAGAARSPPSASTLPPRDAGELEARLAALDALDVEQKLELFS